jgi:hypothetical protein
MAAHGSRSGSRATRRSRGLRRRADDGERGAHDGALAAAGADANVGAGEVEQQVAPVAEAAVKSRSKTRSRCRRVTPRSSEWRSME